MSDEICMSVPEARQASLIRTRLNSQSNQFPKSADLGTIRHLKGSGRLLNKRKQNKLNLGEIDTIDVSDLRKGS